MRAIPVATALSVFSHFTASVSAQREPVGVVQAEYAFAASAKESGVRDAFLKWLAPDSIICSPAPVNGIAANTASEPNADTLEWYPTRSHTAASDDLGYTTGPWTYRTADGKSEAHGTFLSVWRKQPDKTWRVVLDCGVTHAKPTIAPKGLEPVLAPTASVATIWRDPIGSVEARFTAAATADSKAALRSFGAQDLQVMARGVAVAVGIEAGQSLLGTQKLGSVWGHVFAAQSQDGTLGYTWGYIGDAQAEAPTAAYVNIWQRANAKVPWKIVAQSLQVLPPPKKS
jgi:ketosteroid isomerase-like protein